MINLILFFLSIAFGEDHTPLGLWAIWDTTTAAGILNGAGVWDSGSPKWTYENGAKNSPFCQGCNARFGGPGTTGTGGAVTVGDVNRVNNLDFLSSGYTLSGGGFISTYPPLGLTTEFDTTISSVFQGDFILQKSGQAKVILAGANTHTGVEIYLGTVEATHANALGTGTTTLGIWATEDNNVALNLNAQNIANNILVSNQGTGTKTIYGISQYNTQLGQINVPAGGTVTLKSFDAGGGDRWFAFNGKLTGAGTIYLKSGLTPSPTRLTVGNSTTDFTGNIILTTGRVQVQNNAFGTIGAVNLNTGTSGVSELRYYTDSVGSVLINSLNGSGNIYNDGGAFGNLSIGNSNGGGTYTGIISQGLNLVKNGTGVQIINSVNTYTGTTTINNGAIILGSMGVGGINRGTLPGAITLAGGNLGFNPGGTPNTYTYANNFSATASSKISNEDGVGTLSGTINIAAAASLTVGTSGWTGKNLIISGVISGGGGLKIQGNSLIFSNWTTGGDGKVTISSKNTFSGGTEIISGMLELTSAANTPISSIGTGTVTIRSGATLSCITGDNCLGHTTLTNIPQIDIDGGTFTSSPPFSGGNWFRKINFLNGGLVNGVNGLNARPTSQITSQASANTATISTKIFNDSTTGEGLVIDVANGTASPDMIISGVIGSTGLITKKGAGELTLSGNDVYTGSTTIVGGTLNITNANGLGTGTVTINSGAILNCNGHLITNAIVSNGTVQNCRGRFTFLSSGSFTIPTGVTSIQYLVIAGGGGAGSGGGSEVSCSGGGAGGFLTGASLTVVPGSTHAITVGAGGTPNNTTTKTNGGDSSIGTLIVATGGGGGQRGGGIDRTKGNNGGSGAGTVGVNGGGAGGSGIVGQGYNGGLGSGEIGLSQISGSGGGGAGGLGGNGIAGPGRPAGGIGRSSSMSGAAVTYARGGAGGQSNGTTNGASGAANTGDGGTGCDGATIGITGGSGGSGIVIIITN